MSSSGVSGAMAVAAMAQATAAERAHCALVVETFDTKTATIEVKREYADCVFALYGSGAPLAAGDVTVIKIMIVIAFLMMALGAKAGWESGKDWQVAVGGAIIAPLVGYCVLGLVGLVGYGIYFLFT